MEHATHSKLNPRDVDRAETDVLIGISQLTQRGMAKMIGCHESKLSRTDWRFVASVICALGIAAEVSPIGRALQDLYKTIGKKKSPTAGTADDYQITMTF